jgi:hypothetical protein
VLPLASASAREQCRQNSVAGEETGVEVAYGHANLGWSLWRACDGEDAAHRLRHQVEPALLAQWTGLAVARDRAVDQ